MDPTPRPTIDDSVWLVAHVLASTLETCALLYSLHAFPSPLSPAGAIIPRNLILLLSCTLGPHGVNLAGNWLQMALVLALASVAIYHCDADLSPSSPPPSPARGHIRLSSSPPSPTRHLFGPAAALPRVVALSPFLPLFIYLLQSPTTSTSLTTACAFLPPSVRDTLCVPTARAADSVDLVFAYWEEDLDRFREHLDRVRSNAFVQSRKRRRVVVYNKGRKGESEIRQALNLDRRRDEVVQLDNVGREGGTYLHVRPFPPSCSFQ